MPAQNAATHVHAPEVGQGVVLDRSSLLKPDPQSTIPDLPAFLDRRKPRATWRDLIKVHPTADLFPMMTHQELLELGEDIKARGLRSPIVLLDATDECPVCRLLDGRNRLAAMELVGLQVVDADQSKTVPLSAAVGYHILSSATDPAAYVISANIKRRHLTSENKRELITRILKCTPEKSNRAVADMVKADHKTVAAVRREQERTGEIPQLKRTTGKDGKTRSVTSKSSQITASGSVKGQRKRLSTGNLAKQAAVLVADKYIPRPQEEPALAADPLESLKQLWRSSGLHERWIGLPENVHRRFLSWLDARATEES